LESWSKLHDFASKLAESKTSYGFFINGLRFSNAGFLY